MPTALTENPRFVLGLKLRTLRQGRGWSLQEISRRAGLSISYLSEIEKGKKYPKPEKLLDLAEALGVPYDELVSLELDEELEGLRTLFRSTLLREFPFDLFGLAAEDFFSLVSDDPEGAGAFVRTAVEVGRMYDVQVEHLLFSALRSYQQLHDNHFPELEEAAEEERRQRGWSRGRDVGPEALAAILEREHDYRIDTGTLPADPDLATFRAVFVAAERPTLLLNGRLSEAQRAFVLARELGYRRLGLEKRPTTSSWLEFESFEKLLNNFRASYFSGALLIERSRLERDLRAVLGRPSWDPRLLALAVRRYRATPEMFFYRLTELLPTLPGLGRLYFMRFDHPVGGETYRLRKILNMSPVPIPHGMGMQEHHCRRWGGIRLLAGMDREEGDEPPVLAQRCDFFDHGAELLELSMARPLRLQPGRRSAVTIGVLVDRGLARRLAFWDDLPRRRVHLTCERCPLAADECAERDAPPAVRRRQERQERLERALDGVIERVLAAT